MEEDPINRFLAYLSRHAIRVRDVDELRSKLVKLRVDGSSKFQVVSDFDKTLTPQWLNDPCSQTGALVSCHSSYAVIECSSLLSEAYRVTCRDLAAHYVPLENDHRLTPEERIKVNIDWSEKAHVSLLNENLTMNRFREIVDCSWKNVEIHLRGQTSEFFAITRKSNVPVTVLSAGMRDVIERIFELEGIAQDDFMRIVGNALEFDPDTGKHVGFSKPAILPHNKKDAVALFLQNCEIRANRPNALLMGDFPHDVDFIHLIPQLDEFVAIGFLADRKNHHEEALEEYLKHFDIVILGGQANLEIPIELVKCVVG